MAVGQIKFPATQNASVDANTLDDYEEGTFTPTLGDGTNNYTLSVAIGDYVKIGQLVYITATCIWTSIGSAGASQLRMGGAPFTPGGQSNQGFAAALSNLTGFDTTATLNQITALMVQGDSAAYFRRVNDNASFTNLSSNVQSASGNIIVTLLYRAAA